MDKRIFDTMKNGYNRYQVDDYMQTQKLQMDALQKKLESVNRELEMLRQEKKVLENEYRKLNDNLHIKESAASEMARMADRKSVV